MIEPEGYLITRYVTCCPLPREGISQPENIRRVAQAVKRFHALPAIPGAFSPFRTVEEYAAIARRHGVEFPSHSDEQDWYLLECYFGDVTSRQLARHKLMKIASDCREAMWGMVQVGISKLDFDFRAYADKHFAQMAEMIRDARYPEWLGEFGRG